MDIKLKDRFIKLWGQYFNNAQLPITFYYTNEEGRAELVKPNTLPRCLIGALAKIREGQSLCFDINSIGCFGGRRYTGFSDSLRPQFEYFLSCGIPGKLEGERYKKSPELVKEIMKHSSGFKASGKYIVFKRWDMLESADHPEVVIFFAVPDVLAGLFTLCNYDSAEPNGVIAPFGAGCSSIIQYPYQEKDAKRPRAVIGLFDVSARPFVEPNVLSFACPINKFTTMINNMEESFLITESWNKVKKRITT